MDARHVLRRARLTAPLPTARACHLVPFAAPRCLPHHARATHLRCRVLVARTLPREHSLPAHGCASAARARAENCWTRAFAWIALPLVFARVFHAQIGCTIDQFCAADITPLVLPEWLRTRWHHSAQTAHALRGIDRAWRANSMDQQGWTIKRVMFRQIAPYCSERHQTFKNMISRHLLCRCIHLFCALNEKGGRR